MGIIRKTYGNNSNYLWQLDNGHGGIINGVYQTKGKRSPIWPDGSQLFEGEFNRYIVNRVSNLLENEKIDHCILVPEVEDISLPERVKRSNQVYLQHKNSILVSIHSNGGGGEGYEIYTSKGQTKSDVVAPYFKKGMQRYFPDINYREDKIDGDIDKESNFYIIKNSYCPAVLPEHFFMDTYRDCKIIMSESGRQKIAMAIFVSILMIEKQKPI